MAVSFTHSNYIVNTSILSGASNGLFSSSINGVHGGSRSLYSSNNLNKAFLQNKPQNAKATQKQTYNSSKSLLPNGYYFRSIATGQQLDSNRTGTGKL